MMKKTEKGGFPKKWIAVGAVALIILILIGWFISTYNSIINADQEVIRSWADVETQYQRRVDLIPNLVNTVKGYATYEQNVLTKITDLRSQWMRSTSAEDRVNTANQIEGALKTIFAVAENYPQLKADSTFIGLMDELSGTENRVAVARMKYNEVVKNYNNKVKFIPSNAVAGWMGMKERTPFQSAEGAENAPVVNVTI
ncbi:MAG: LemA family protein [Candidatus Aenigmarchaeota archaeon]|nr:LemA family protein [Candidatus Aenigmarchaeota archaeon]